MQMVKRSTAFPQAAQILMHIYVTHLTMPISVARKKVLSVTFLFTIETTGTSVPVFISTIPFSDCLKDKPEHIQLFCAVLCTTFVCSVMLTLTHTHIYEQFSLTIVGLF